MARNILLKLVLDADETKAELDDVSEKMSKFGTKDVTAEIRVDADQAKREIDETIAMLEVVPKEVTTRLRIQAETDKLARYQAALMALKAEADATPVGDKLRPGLTTDMATQSRLIEGSRTRITGLMSDLEKLAPATAAVGEEAEKTFTMFERGAQSATKNVDKLTQGLAQGVAKLAEKVPLLGGMFANLANSIGKAAGGSGSLVEAFGSLASVGAALLPVAGILAAIVVSLGEAIVGVAALGVAFLAALGPIALVLGVVADKIKDIVSGQQTLKSAAENLKSAYDSQKAAVVQLQQAEVNENRQRIQALDAQMNAVNALHDAENQLADAKLGALSAAQQVQQAKLTLASFDLELRGLGTSPGDLNAATQNVQVGGNLGQQQVGSNKLAFQEQLLQWKEDILGVKEAYQQEHEAQQNVTDSTTALMEAQQTAAQYQTEGLKAYPDYLSAINAVTDAQMNLKRATDQVASAQLAQSQAIKHGASEAAGFEAAWKALKKTLGEVLGPAEAAVFSGIETSMAVLAKGLKPLTPAFTELGKAIGHAFVWWAEMMSKPGNVKILSGLISDAAKMTSVFSRYLGAVLRVLLQVAHAAMPTLLKTVGTWASELETVSHRHGAIAAFIHKCLSQTKMWWDAIKQVAGIVIELAHVFGPVLTIVEKILVVCEQIGKAVGSIIGIGSKTGGGIGGIAGIAAMFFGGKALLKGVGGLGSGLFGDAAEGGALGAADVALPAVAAAAGGYAFGSQINKWTGASNFIGNLIGTHTTVGGPTAAMNAASSASLATAIAHIEQVLKTGHWLNGGAATTAAQRASLMTELKGLQAKPATVVNHNTFAMRQGDTVGSPEHFVTAVEKRLKSKGTGFGGRG